MRCIFVADSSFDHIEEKFFIEDENSLHHLRVIRLKNNEKLLLVNGSGKGLLTTVELIEKYKVSLAVREVIVAQDVLAPTLFLFPPKKEALEDIFRMACEMSVKTIVLGKSSYSQAFVEKEERTHSIFVNAIQQSNFLYYPEIVQLKSWQDSIDYLAKLKNKFVFFDGQKKDLAQNASAQEVSCLVIGPEGGFSAGEVEELLNLRNALCYHFPTSIMRSPTAVAAALGWWYAQS